MLIDQCCKRCNSKMPAAEENLTSKICAAKKVICAVHVVPPSQDVACWLCCHLWSTWQDPHSTTRQIPKVGCLCSIWPPRPEVISFQIYISDKRRILRDNHCLYVTHTVLIQLWTHQNLYVPPALQDIQMSHWKTLEAQHHHCRRLFYSTVALLAHYCCLS